MPAGASVIAHLKVADMLPKPQPRATIWVSSEQKLYTTPTSPEVIWGF
jgi:hypothetical protein